MHIHLTPEEQAVLTQPDTNTSGGFQGLIRKLNAQLDATGTLELDSSDLEKIRRYAFSYRSGGWQGRLLAIFGRTLGPNLQR